MKSTKFIIYLFLALVSLSSCDEKNRPLYDENKYGQFVRFAMVLDNNGDPIQGEIDPSKAFATRYEHKDLTAIKIPVVLSSSTLDHDVTVGFVSQLYGDFSDYTISPSDSLTFNAQKLTDTITISFTSKWDTLTVDSLCLELTASSDDNITIGYPFGFEDNSKITIVLSDLVFPYTIPSPNSFDLTGAKDEDITFSILFSNGFLKEDLEGKELLDISNADFLYTLTQHPFQTGDKKVIYTFTVEEELDNPYKYYDCTFELSDIEGYTSFGNKEVTFAKQIENKSNNNINMARHFYDNHLDAYNRMYTLFFIDYFDKGECKWRESFAYSFPVEVSADHPNAVLHEDGKYYHAFQIGFNSHTPRLTTNSFALKYWFEDYSTMSEDSPGFNVLKAIEFYPKDGESYTEGSMSIIKQDLVISSKEKKSYTISIAGEGTYHYVEGSQEMYNDSIFELDFEFEVTNEELYGGTRKYQYKMMNKNPEKTEYPDSLNTGCYTSVVL